MWCRFPVDLVDHRNRRPEGFNPRPTWLPKLYHEGPTTLVWDLLVLCIRPVVSDETRVWEHCTCPFPDPSRLSLLSDSFCTRGRGYLPFGQDWRTTESPVDPDLEEPPSTTQNPLPLDTGIKRPRRGTCFRRSRYGRLRDRDRWETHIGGHSISKVPSTPRG